MTRQWVLLLALVAGGTPARGGDDGIPLNEKYKGTTGADAGVPPLRGRQELTYDTVEIALKSGQRIEFQVEMVGQRGAAIILWNKDMVTVGTSWVPARSPSEVGRLSKANIGDGEHKVILSPKSARLLIPEVPASGTYKVTVIAGDYTILAKDASKKRDAATVRAELDAAKRRVADLEKELQSLEKK